MWGLQRYLVSFARGADPDAVLELGDQNLPMVTRFLAAQVWLVDTAR